jgi:pyridoxamine 5'-phosphate oxidase-like protein
VSITTERQKFRNVSRDPRVALSIQDPERTLRYIEVRGTVTPIDPDPTGEQTLAVGRKYGSTRTEVPDRDVRIILTITPARFSTHPLLTRQA